MKMYVDRTDIRELYDAVSKNTNFFSTYINLYVSDESIKEMLKNKVSEIEYWMNRVYNPHVIEQKEKANHLYKLWLTLKDQNPQLGFEIYSKYLETKAQIKRLQQD
ncbi:MAG: hypothetical protein ACD_26C00116G0001 [uncultured bacterium]|nr:MAG: hypothetical protein ACD_26C00116G0001 [uncultured bacterium]